MAFLVCYSKSAPHDHTERTAVYLDQQFYEVVFQHCTSDRSHYPSLSVIASLRYKSPLLVIPTAQLRSLAEELQTLAQLGQQHPQLAELEQVCAKALSDGYSLSISADMYPEL
jgi:hypothetical protein